MFTAGRWTASLLSHNTVAALCCLMQHHIPNSLNGDLAVFDQSPSGIGQTDAVGGGGDTARSIAVVHRVGREDEGREAPRVTFLKARGARQARTARLWVP
jgi:hypothetical protein